jgi:glycosyltransferase involved in cell wall biosynthesis
VSPERPIAYVLGSFPQASQQFITREIRGLRAFGIRLQVFALARRSPEVLEEADARWFAEVVFVPRAMAPPVLLANLRQAAADPQRYLRACWKLLRLPHRPRALVFRSIVLMLRAAWIAQAIERAGGCRHVHAHFALAQTEVAMAVSTLLGVPYTFTAHARDIYATPSALEEKIRSAALVLTCTAYNMEHLRALVPDVPPERIEVVHHGVDLGVAVPIAPESGETSSAPAAASRDDDGAAVRAVPLILAAGRLVEKKGFETLIDACAELERRRLPFACRIYGTGPLAGALHRRIDAARMDDRIVLPGWIAPRALAEAMRSAAVFVMPSRLSRRGDRDGIPNVVLEAMSAGLPVVATRLSGIPEAVVDGRTGLLVEPDDPGALAEAIARLLGDAPLRRAFGTAGHLRAREEFALDVSSARLADSFSRTAPHYDRGRGERR